MREALASVKGLHPGWMAAEYAAVNLTKPHIQAVIFEQENQSFATNTRACAWPSIGIHAGIHGIEQRTRQAQQNHGKATRPPRLRKHPMNEPRMRLFRIPVCWFSAYWNAGFSQAVHCVVFYTVCRI